MTDFDLMCGHEKANAKKVCVRRDGEKFLLAAGLGMV